MRSYATNRRRTSVMSEQDIQRTLCDHLRRRPASGVSWFAVPNGGYRRRTEAAIMRDTGTRAGIPDLTLIRNGKTYFLEVKKPGGKLSAAQNAAIAELEGAGATCGVCYGLDECLKWLEGHNLLRGRSNK